MITAGCKSPTTTANGTPPTETPKPAEKPKEDAAPTIQYENPAMLDSGLATKTSPDVYKVKLETTQGDMVFEINRKWSPRGADRFYNMVDIGYFNDVVIFRAMEGFMFQFGIHGDPNVNAEWGESKLIDDMRNPKIKNVPGMLTFAKTGRPNSRSVQMFVNLGDNSASLDKQGFTPFGKIVEGEEVMTKINTQYGNSPSDHQGPFQEGGNKYILSNFPNLDLIKSASFVN